jgi:DNA-directed RNA polymerase specialized sigma24 family protein
MEPFHGTQVSNKFLELQMRTIPNYPPSIGDLLKNIGDTFESQQNRFNRAMFQAQPPKQQEEVLQNGYNNGMSVQTLSKMTGVPKSTIYSKIKTD